ncbi:hypothetical protein ABEY69_00525 [Priestia filamentosa]|uniref:hypothetical protein n=1 Tax=Priestia filamentosa TaxID=1402861 RepID=UPI003D2D1212
MKRVISKALIISTIIFSICSISTNQAHAQIFWDYESDLGDVVSYVTDPGLLRKKDQNSRYGNVYKGANGISAIATYFNSFNYSMELRYDFRITKPYDDGGILGNNNSFYWDSLIKEIEKVTGGGFVDKTKLVSYPDAEKFFKDSISRSGLSKQVEVASIDNPSFTLIENVISNDRPVLLTLKSYRYNESNKTDQPYMVIATESLRSGSLRELVVWDTWGSYEVKWEANHTPEDILLDWDNIEVQNAMFLEKSDEDWYKEFKLFYM